MSVFDVSCACNRTVRREAEHRAGVCVSNATVVGTVAVEGDLQSACRREWLLHLAQLS